MVLGMLLAIPRGERANTVLYFPLLSGGSMIKQDKHLQDWASRGRAGHGFHSHATPNQIEDETADARIPHYISASSSSFIE